MSKTLLISCPHCSWTTDLVDDEARPLWCPQCKSWLNSFPQVYGPAGQLDFRALTFYSGIRNHSQPSESCSPTDDGSA